MNEFYNTSTDIKIENTNSFNTSINYSNELFIQNIKSLDDDIDNISTFNYIDKNDSNNILIDCYKKSKNIISSKLNIDDEYKNNLIELTNVFLSSLEPYIVTNFSIFPLDEDTICFNFKSKDIHCEIELFYFPDEKAEYLASIKKNNITILNQISNRNDFNDITSKLYLIPTNF